MSDRLVLASGSEIRAKLFRDAGVDVEIVKPRVDEDSIKQALLADGVRPRDIADALAEQKARKVSQKLPPAIVIGCDQVLEFDGQLISKPKSEQEAIDQIAAMSGGKHKLISAAVIYEDAKPIWRHVGGVTLHMRQVGDTYLKNYVARNWDSIQHSVGGYKLEEEGIRLFHRIDGDYYHVLGIPFLEILSYLALRGEIEG